LFYSLTLFLRKKAGDQFCDIYHKLNAFAFAIDASGHRP